MEGRLVEVEDRDGAREGRLVGTRGVPVQLDVVKLGVLAKHLAMEESCGVWCGFRGGLRGVTWMVQWFQAVFHQGKHCMVGCGFRGGLGGGTWMVQSVLEQFSP